MMHAIFVLGWIGAVSLIVISTYGLAVLYKHFGFEFDEPMQQIGDVVVTVKHLYLIELVGLLVGLILWWAVQ